jgi:hypothetical protein
MEWNMAAETATINPRIGTEIMEISGSLIGTALMVE